MRPQRVPDASQHAPAGRRGAGRGIPRIVADRGLRNGQAQPGRDGRPGLRSGRAHVPQRAGVGLPGLGHAGTDPALEIPVGCHAAPRPGHGAPSGHTVRDGRRTRQRPETTVPLPPCRAALGRPWRLGVSHATVIFVAAISGRQPRRRLAAARPKQQAPTASGPIQLPWELGWRQPFRLFDRLSYRLPLWHPKGRLVRSGSPRLRIRRVCAKLKPCRSQRLAHEATARCGTGATHTLGSTCRPFD